MKRGWVLVVAALALVLGFVIGRAGPAALAGNGPTVAGGAAPSNGERVIRVEAKRFAFSPARIEVKNGEAVVLELVSLDRIHGFSAPELGLRHDIVPGTSTRIPFKPTQAGTFSFHCDVFCGSGHEGMEGEIVVTD